MDPSLLFSNVLMTYLVSKPRSKGDDEETMPPGKRSKKKQQKRNRKRRQLLERSRRSRDDLINSALEETDVVAFMPTPRGGVLSSLSHHSSFCEVTDGPLFSTPAGDSKLRGRTLFVNSTPRRRSSYSPSPSRFCSPLRSNSLVLTPVISVEDEMLCGDDETDKTAVQLARITSSTDKSDKTDFKFRWIENLKDAVVTFLNSVSSYFWNLYLSITSIRIFKEKSEEKIDIASKLDEILNCMTEMSIKQDQFYERQENLFNRLAVLEAKMAHGAFPSIHRPTSGGPPPPPPPPPPMPLLGITATPQPLEIVKKSQNALAVPSNNKPSRPSITLEDILGVQLKKTPAVKPFSERTPSKASTGPRGPLVSVDMIRSVKLKPPNMRRRQSLERPLQTPSSIFNHVRTTSICESDIEP